MLRLPPTVQPLLPKPCRTPHRTGHEQQSTHGPRQAQDLTYGLLRLLVLHPIGRVQPLIQNDANVLAGQQDAFLHDLLRLLCRQVYRKTSACRLSRLSYDPSCHLRRLVGHRIGYGFLQLLSTRQGLHYAPRLQLLHSSVGYASARSYSTSGLYIYTAPALRHVA